jgi:hypothetical protein
LAANPILTSIISELIARNPQSVEEASTTDLSLQIYGENGEQAAAIAYTKWKRYASQTDMYEFYQHVMRHVNGYDDGLEKYRDWYVEPFFDYLDEVLEDSNIILATLTRYKSKVEWYRRKELQQLFTEHQSRGENVLAKHMYEYLFDQGIPFHVEPQSASGRPDVVSLEDSEHPFIGDAKVFDAESRGATYIRKGFYQLYQYLLDYNESVGHLIVFNVSNKQLRFEMPSTGGVPRFEYNHKTIFVTMIDIHAHEGTASTRSIPDTLTITSEEIVREVAEQTPSQTSQTVSE